MLPRTLGADQEGGARRRPGRAEPGRTPGRQPQHGELFRKGLGIAGLKPGAVHGLGQQLLQGVLSFCGSGIVADYHQRAPEPQGEHQLPQQFFCRPSPIKPIPEIHNVFFAGSAEMAGKRELPKDFARSSASAAQGQAQAGRRNGVLPPGRRRRAHPLHSGGQIPFFFSQQGDRLQRQLPWACHEEQHRRLLPPLSLDLPGAPAIAGVQDRTQLPHGPAALPIEEVYSVKRKVLSGFLQLPGMAAVGAVQHNAAGSACDPDLCAGGRQGVPVAGNLDSGGQMQVHESPGGSPALAAQHQSALPGSQQAPRAQRGHRLDAPSAQVIHVGHFPGSLPPDPQSASHAAQNALCTPETTRQPTRTGRTRNRFPGAAAVAGLIQPRRKTPCPIAQQKAILCIGKVYPIQSGQGPFVECFPGAAAVARRQKNPYRASLG
jgi:hypothetical protein